MSMQEEGSHLRLTDTIVNYSGKEISPSLVATLQSSAEKTNLRQPSATGFARLQEGQLFTRYERSGREFLQDFEHTVIFEDTDLLIINKPPFLASRGNNPQQFGVEEIARHVRKQDIYLAHRLDAGTTGVLFLTKGVVNLIRMSSQFADKEASDLKKYYATLLDGEFEEPRVHEVQTRVRKVEGTSHLMEVVPSEETDHSSRYTRTIFTPLALLATPSESPLHKTPTLVRLVTGQKHQIRVVAAQTLGMPITGDVSYGSTHAEFGRPMLHALRVDFTHPTTGERNLAIAPMPPSMKSTINSLTIVQDYRRSK